MIKKTLCASVLLCAYAIPSNSFWFSPFDMREFEALRTISDSFRNMHINEKEDSYTVYLEVPGFDKDDITIDIAEHRFLTVNARHAHTTPEATDSQTTHPFRNDRTFHYTTRLAQPVQTENIKADLKNGILTIELPKQEKPALKQTRIHID